VLITPLQLVDEPLHFDETIVPGTLDYATDIRQITSLPIQGIADLLVEYRCVAGYTQIMIDDIRHPDQIIRESCANSLPTLRMPPVLHIAFFELARCASQDVRARKRRLCIHECHHILQLIAESIRAAPLIQSGSRPHSA